MSEYRKQIALGAVIAIIATASIAVVATYLPTLLTPKNSALGLPFKVTTSFIIDPSAILTGTFGTASDTHGDSFFANGYYWAFFTYVNGSIVCAPGNDQNCNVSLFYSTSSNGVLWTKPVTVVTDIVASYFSVWPNGNSVYLVADKASVSSGLSNFLYGVGTITGSTINWATMQTISLSNMNPPADPTVVLDSNGRPWISYISDPSVGTIAVITSNLTANQNWTMAKGFPHVFPRTYVSPSLGGVNPRIQIVPLTSGRVAAVYSNYTLVTHCNTPYDCTHSYVPYVYADSWNGTAFSIPVATPTDSNSSNGQAFSAVSVGDNMNLVYDDGQNRLGFTTYSYSTNSFTPESVIYTKAVAAPALSKDSVTNNLYLFWANDSGVLLHTYSSLSKIWISAPTAFSNARIAGQNALSVSYQSAVNGTTNRIITVEWLVPTQNDLADVWYGSISGSL